MALLDSFKIKASPRLLGYIFIIALGGAVNGIDGGIVATTLGQESFNTYMFPKGTTNVSSLTGAIVSSASAGTAVGSLCAGFVLEKLGRRWTMAVSTFFTIVGAIFQTAANGVALLIFGRALGGIALGILGPTMPVYISELARPSERARLVGIFGFMIAIGFCLANWIGYGCSFAQGDVSWRLALSMQIPLAALLLVLTFFLPESPRWLAQQERYDDFEQTIRRIYSTESEEFVQTSKLEIQEQLRLENEQRTNTNVGHALMELFSWKYIRRTALAIMVMQVGILSGSLAIQNYQAILYQSLGFEGKNLLLISGCYGFMGIVGQVINLVFVSDRWPRVRTMWLGCLVLACMLAVLMALSKFYGDGSNESGARAGIAFIFLYSGLYAVFFNSTLFTIAAETFPFHLRGYGTATASFCQGITAIWLGQVTPFAFEAISWKYYAVFISCLVALSAFYKAFLSETNQMSLEAIAGNFGDQTVVGTEKLDLDTTVSHVSKEKREA